MTTFLRGVTGSRLVRLTILISLFIFTNLFFGCNGCTGCSYNAPAALKPTLGSVLARLTPSGPWVNVGANPSGKFEILPSGFPSGGIKFVFSAPWPTSLHVQIDGTDVPDFANVPSGTDPAVTGFFSIQDINPNPNPAVWTIGFRPPNSKLMQPMYEIRISDISPNQSYPVGDPRHESDPLVIDAVRQKVFTLSVFKTGSGAGTVTSTPSGIMCGGTCIFDFGQSTTVTLTPNPAADSTFDGWTGDCTGSGPCQTTLTGIAGVVTAKYTASTNNSLLQNCPAVVSQPGFVYVGQPGCATNDIAGHPSAQLACDNSGYFCCELSQGSNDPKCGQDHRQFPADCLAYAPQAPPPFPSGCYAPNGPLGP
jgi:hypothetical protein